MNTELQTDDEVIREQAMTAGETKVAGIKLKATSAIEVSYMQRFGVLQPGNDILWKAAAFAFLHSADRKVVRTATRNEERFQDAVDDWLERNNPSMDDVKELASEMNVRITEWFSSMSETEGSGPGN